VIRRITGKTLGRFFADEIAGPLGADYHIGTGPECDARVAPFVQAVREVGTNGDPIHDRVSSNPDLNPKTSSSVPFRRAEIGAANGHGNARAVATIHSALVADVVNGVRLLSRPGRERVLEPQAEGVDLVMVFPCGGGWDSRCTRRCSATPSVIAWRIGVATAALSVSSTSMRAWQ
jgi:hypothetical protein